MLKVYTAQLRYSGPDRLDVTRQGNDPFGVSFAPSKQILNYYRPRNDFAGYSVAYQDEMTRSYDVNHRSWKQLLAMDEVTLVCFCPGPVECHRYLLAAILV